MPSHQTQTKRKRELAKLDRRQAKDQKRALRKAERAKVGEPNDARPGIHAPAAARPDAPSNRPQEAPKPQTLAAIAERWKSMRVAKPKVGR